MNPLSCFAPAKVNLKLHVTGRRDDGYHLLDMLNVAVSHGDSVQFLGLAQHSGCVVDLSVAGTAEHLPASMSDNLITRSIYACVQQGLLPEGRYKFQLTKKLPVGAGLGGGSSDAAAAVRAVVAALKIELRVVDLIAVLASLGSDIPYFFNLSPARVSGIGDKVERLPDRTCEKLIGKTLLLILPDIRVSTPAVYSWLREKRVFRDDSDAQSDVEEFIRQPFSSSNDLLEPALALEPGLKKFVDLLELVENIDWGMSGSGSSFFVFDPSPDIFDRLSTDIGTSAQVVKTKILAGNEKELCPFY